MVPSCAAIVALTREALSFVPCTELMVKEAEVIGVSDHLASELPSLMRYAQSGQLTFPESALRFVDLDAAHAPSSHSTNGKRRQFSATSGSVIANAALDALESSTDHVRTVIVPNR